MSEILYGLLASPVTLAVALLAAAALIWLMVWALREGREISFWPPRIGARPQAAAATQPSPPAPMSPTASHLPGRTYTRFLGRKRELAAIVDLLTDRNNRQIVAISGLGGTGKTALALETVAICQRKKLFDHVFWETAKEENFVGGEIQRRDAAEISLPKVLEAIGQRAGTDAKQFLASNRCLVVLDNIETVPDYRALVAGIVQLTGDRSRFLITARPQFTAWSEVFNVLLGGLDEGDAVDLLRDEIKNRGLAVNVDDAGLRRIAEAAGGAPLAMKLLAGHLRHADAESIAGELLRMEDASTEAMYAFIYRASWMRLSKPARKILLAMTAFPATADMHSISVVSLLSRDELKSALRELVEVSLLDLFRPEDELPRYGIHPLTRHFLYTELHEQWT